MRNCYAVERRTACHLLLVACAAALGVALTAVLPAPAHADHVAPPPVPPNIQVPAGSKIVFQGHAVGTQNYICLPSGAGAAWVFFGPQATLFKDNGSQLITHFLSPNPDERGVPRATWQDSDDTSAIWAVASASSSDPHFVAPGAIPWLLLQVVGAEDGPSGGDTLSRIAFIQRLNTSGGVAPTGCTLSTDVGSKALVPYRADYFFYKATNAKAAP